MLAKIASWSPDAWSAGGTIAATIVALFLPLWSTKREWRRQNAIREADAASQRKAVSDLHRDLCWTVDRVIAYREAAQAVFKTGLIFLPAAHALRRIGVNCSVLESVLQELKTRPQLTDGALYSASAGETIAKAVAASAAAGVKGLGQTNQVDEKSPYFYFLKLGALADIDAIAAARMAEVRSNFGISESVAAKKIRDKYSALVADLRHAHETDGKPKDFDASSYD